MERTISWVSSAIFGCFIGGTFISGYGVFASLGLNLGIIAVIAAIPDDIAYKHWPINERKLLNTVEVTHREPKYTPYGWLQND